MTAPKLLFPEMNFFTTTTRDFPARYPILNLMMMILLMKSPKHMFINTMKMAFQ